MLTDCITSYRQGQIFNNSELWIGSSFQTGLFIFERQSASRGGAEREGDTESEAGSRLQAVSTEPNVGLELTNRETVT